MITSGRGQLARVAASGDDRSDRCGVSLVEKVALMTPLDVKRNQLIIRQGDLKVTARRAVTAAHRQHVSLRKQLLREVELIKRDIQIIKKRIAELEAEEGEHGE